MSRTINEIYQDMKTEAKNFDSFSIGEQVRFEGIVFEANQSVAPGESPATNPEKWETISNLTYIST